MGDAIGTNQKVSQSGSISWANIVRCEKMGFVFSGVLYCKRGEIAGNFTQNFSHTNRNGILNTSAYNALYTASVGRSIRYVTEDI